MALGIDTHIVYHIADCVDGHTEGGKGYTLYIHTASGRKVERDKHCPSTLLIADRVMRLSDYRLLDH